MDTESAETLLGSWGITGDWQGLVLIISILGATAVVSFVGQLVLVRLENRLTRTSNLWDDVFLHAARKPIQVFIWLQGVYWAAEVAYRYSDAELFTANDLLLKFGFILLIAWALLRFVTEVEKVLVSDRVDEPVDYTTMLAIGKLLRAVIVITSALVLIQNMGYSISGVLAFGGIGGIAVGFAARDMLANFFGGAVVYLDKPFKVGDWVRSPDANIEGVVEHIGWRITRIRTFDQRPLYVPNAIFTTIAVENPSRMFNRRIFETIGVRYGDVTVVEPIANDIRQMLHDHEEIDNNRVTIVNFVAFNASSLDIMVYAFTKTTQWVEFHRIKEEILLRISEIITSHGAEIAFPTRTLHLAGNESPEFAGLSDPTPESSSEGPSLSRGET